MPAGARQREYMTHEQPLRELEPVLVGEWASALGIHLGSARDQAWDQRGGVVDELLDANRLRETIGQLVIERLGVDRHERVAGGCQRRGQVAVGGVIAVTVPQQLLAERLAADQETALSAAAAASNESGVRPPASAHSSTSLVDSPARVSTSVGSPRMLGE